jgi:hypothetical protein
MFSSFIAAGAGIIPLNGLLPLQSSSITWNCRPQCWITPLNTVYTANIPTKQRTCSQKLVWCTDDEYYYRQRFIARDLRSYVVWICGRCRYADVQNSSISIDHETLKARKVCSVQLWTMTKNFDNNHPNIRHWPWDSSFKVTEQNYFSIYFRISLPICTHCQRLKWSHVCI